MTSGDARFRGVNAVRDLDRDGRESVRPERWPLDQRSGVRDKVRLGSTCTLSRTLSGKFELTYAWGSVKVSNDKIRFPITTDGYVTWWECLRNHRTVNRIAQASSLGSDRLCG